MRGCNYAPLHKNVPKAALADPQLYELLVLVDALRDGNAREREVAVKDKQETRRERRWTFQILTCWSDGLKGH